MIELPNSQFTQIMPENLASQRETQAFAYALGMQVQKLCQQAERVLIYGNLERAPESLLDYLGAELRTPAYDDRFPVEVKRELIAGTLAFYTKLGTPEAVNQMIRAIFGNGSIEEWFDYEGEPHHFRALIGVDGREITPDTLRFFRRVIASIKRLSSWLDAIITVTDMPGSVYMIPARGPLLSMTGLPRREPELKPAAIYTLPGLWGRTSITALPQRAPVFDGAMTLGVGFCRGGSFSATRLPPAARPVQVGTGAVLGGNLAVTHLPPLS